MTIDTVNAASDTIVLGMGCFWGAQKRMQALPGVIATEAGYANGEIDGNYETILRHERLLRLGLTQKRNHAEVVKVVFDPARTSLAEVLAHFWENHDPTQGDRQGNDIGSNYRSAIYTTRDEQLTVAQKSRDLYQAELARAGFGPITTEIAPLASYFRAEEYHQDYLKKNPQGYCGLGGTGIRHPHTRAVSSTTQATSAARLAGQALARERQLVVFEAAECGHCRRFAAEILADWRSPVPIARSLVAEPPTGWTLARPLFAMPTVVLFEHGQEVSRYTGYDGDRERFWQWLGHHLLSPEQRRIAFEHGTERPWSGSHLDEKRPGVFVDPITGAPLFRSNAKFDSGTGWPSFFEPVPGALTYHEDHSYGMRRIEVRSASSGIHLGHVFDDGPPPTGKRYCINGNVLRFVPD